MRWTHLWFITNLYATCYTKELSTVNESKKSGSHNRSLLTINRNHHLENFEKHINIQAPDNGQHEFNTINNEQIANLAITKETYEEENNEEDTPPILVTTDLGDVQGHIWQHSDEIISYLDIPYGKFTLFKPPEKANKWDEIHSVTKHSKRCPQVEDNVFVGNLDCLTLSIFTPKAAENADVLFYIHDGSSNTGSGDPYKYGPEFLVKKGIILVLPNYRLGALGFLCLQNSIAPGNAALRDLALALEWTKNNIEAFGGNPSNIVVSGDSKSGALAGYLAISSESKKYISKVISESGPVLSHWAIDRNPIETSSKFIKDVRGTAVKDNEDLLNDKELELMIKTTSDFPFRPCIENNSSGIIRKSPWTTLKEESFNMSFIIGSADHAGLPEAMKHDDETLSQLNENFENALPNDLFFPDATTKSKVGQRIREQYFGNDNITSEARKYLSLYHTDVSYLSADLRLARALVEAGATVYLYEFSFIGEFNDALKLIDDASQFGATRGDVAGYIFSLNGRTPKADSEEEKVVKTMTNLWVSFIKNGEPTIEGVTWHRFNASEEKLEPWLSISDEASSKTGFHYDRLSLWTDVYRDYFIDKSGTINIKAFGNIYYMTTLLLIIISTNVV